MIPVVALFVKSTIVRVCKQNKTPINSALDGTSLISGWVSSQTLGLEQKKRKFSKVIVL